MKLFLSLIVTISFFSLVVFLKFVCFVLFLNFVFCSSFYSRKPKKKITTIVSNYIQKHCYTSVTYRTRNIFSFLSNALVQILSPRLIVNVNSITHNIPNGQCFVAQKRKDGPKQRTVYTTFHLHKADFISLIIIRERRHDSNPALND